VSWWVKAGVTCAVQAKPNTALPVDLQHKPTLTERPTGAKDILVLNRNGKTRKTPKEYQIKTLS